MKKRIAIPLFSPSVLLVVAYLGIGYVIYDKLTKVERGGGANAANTPAQFVPSPTSKFASFDTTPYFMPQYEDVRLPSRQPGLMLAAWYVEADPAAPAVILVHGLNGCKCNTSVLIPAGMLHRAGLNVLMFDMRDMGMSDIEDGRYSAGTKEYLDMLGAWDWLIANKGIPPERIGLFGVSLGAATALNAFAAEPRVAAAFVDSPFADMQTVMNEELARNSYPTWLAPGGVLMARLVSGDDILSRSPLDAIRNDAGRPIFITHGEGDKRINVHHARDLAALAAQTTANVQTWFVPGADHVEAMYLETPDYERRLTEFFKTVLGEQT